MCTVAGTGRTGAPRSTSTRRAPRRPCRSTRRPLARRGVELDRLPRQLDGDDIDRGAAVGAWVGARTDAAPDRAVYINGVRKARDLAVLSPAGTGDGAHPTPDSELRAAPVRA